MSSLLSIQAARSLHFLVMCWFLLFIVMHVTLVLTTGLRANLNHMFAARDDDSWVGFWIFAAAMVVLLVAWVAATPFTLRHPRVVQRVGPPSSGPCSGCSSTSTRNQASTPRRDISPYFWHNGKYPETEEYKALFDGVSPTTAWRSAAWSATPSS